MPTFSRYGSEESGSAGRARRGGPNSGAPVNHTKVKVKVKADGPTKEKAKPAKAKRSMTAGVPLPVWAGSCSS
jgi:hypothetical protein